MLAYSNLEKEGFSFNLVINKSYWVTYDQRLRFCIKRAFRTFQMLLFEQLHKYQINGKSSKYEFSDDWNTAVEMCSQISKLLLLHSKNWPSHAKLWIWSLLMICFLIQRNLILQRPSITHSASKLPILTASKTQKSNFVCCLLTSAGREARNRHSTPAFILKLGELKIKPNSKT